MLSVLLLLSDTPVLTADGFGVAVVVRAHRVRTLANAFASSTVSDVALGLDVVACDLVHVVAHHLALEHARSSCNNHTCNDVITNQ